MRIKSPKDSSRHMIRAILTLISLAFAGMSMAQGVLKGRIINQEGDPLPYATIYVAQTGSGSISNISGQYELRLPPGLYDISFQFLGYKTERIRIELGQETVKRDIVLTEQAFRLAEAQIKAGDEDPAYPIMRKAIAKSKFHSKQVDAYSCEVYLKGGGRLVDMPKLFWKLAKSDDENNLDTSASFITESVSRVRYTRPATYEEEVISIRSSGDDRNSSPMAYINGSFYEPKVAGIVSPLSPRAFAYYRFQYLSSYSDGKHMINKINVIPRRKNEDVVSGVLHLVEGLWSIHSFEFDLLIQGIPVQAKQVFAPIEENVWLPVSHRYDGQGNIFGVKFEFGYLATVSDYVVEVNPDLAEEIVVIDEKTEKEVLRQRESQRELSGKDLSQETSSSSADEETRLMAGEELSRKELMKLMRQYEKEERKKRDAPEVERVRRFEIDSAAYSSDSLYWVQRRPIPLSEREQKGYEIMDEAAEERRKKEEGDTLGGGSKFGLSSLIFGEEYDLGRDRYLKLHSPLPGFGFNTVDGYNFEYRISYIKRFSPERRLEISPMGRAMTARRQSMGTLRGQYHYRKGTRQGKLSLEGGWYYSQFNANDPIPQFQNSVSTLIFQNNFMKVYDRNFAALKWSHDLRHNLRIEPEVWYEERVETFNNTEAVWFPASDRGYTPNAPTNVELSETGFGRSDAFKMRFSMRYMPLRRFGKINDRYYESRKGPAFRASITRALPEVYNSSIDYTLVSLGFKNIFDLGALGRLGLNAEAGRFIQRGQMEFPDFAHFMGNQTVFTRFGQLNGFSLLEYYDFSTADRYFHSYLNYSGREILLTRILPLRMSGLKENINFNYLISPMMSHYFEVGYSLTNVLRFGRIDFVSGFSENGYREFRIQIGIESSMFSTR